MLSLGARRTDGAGQMYAAQMNETQMNGARMNGLLFLSTHFFCQEKFLKM